MNYSAPAMENDKDIRRSIKSSRGKITILFTDIEGSTKKWEKLGDIEGRWMVNEHNRLLFPVVYYYGGKIIKTIGDSIMASFKNRKKAIKAAIAMQQILEKRRAENKKFQVNIRIGLHTGKALIEKDDVFGDSVNTAARIEAFGSGNEIWASESTANGLDPKAIHIGKTKKFKPRGKNESIDLHRIDWGKCEDYSSKVKLNSFFAISRKQVAEIILYSLASILSLSLVFWNYLRFLLVDHEFFSQFVLNPILLLENKWTLWFITGLVFIVMTYLMKNRSVPVALFRWLRGGMFFLITYVVLLIAEPFFPAEWVSYLPNWNQSILTSQHMLVEVVEPKSFLYEKPSRSSKKIQPVIRGQVMLLSDVEKSEKMDWNKVLLPGGAFGFIPRVTPPAMGVEQKRVTMTNKFFLSGKELYLLCLSLLLFIWGGITFRLKLR